MADTGEDRTASELKGCRESLGGIRNELGNSIGQVQAHVADLRGLLDQLQSSHQEMQARLEGLRQNSTDLELQIQAVRNFDSRLEGMENTLLAVESAPAPEVPTVPLQGMDPIFIKNALKNLTEGSSQEDILERFMEAASAKVSRAILFLNRDNRFVVWKQRGFVDEALEAVVVEDPNDPVMRAANNRRLIYQEQAPAEARPSLGETGEFPHAFVVIPLVFDDFVPVILYGDSSERIEADALELLSYITVLVLKNNALRESAPEAAPVEMAAPAVEPPPPGVLEPFAAAAPVVEEVAEPVFVEAMVETEAPAAPETPPFAEWEVSEPQPPESAELTEQVEPAAVPVEEAVAPPPAEQALGEEAAPGAPPELPIEQVPAISAEDEEKYNSEARRFARLLVSEIKLYNEDEVYNGRQNADLYSRLKRDVDRSREMYEKRVHPAVARHTDHFHEELVRILAREDAGLLGSDYPGPILRA